MGLLLLLALVVTLGMLSPLVYFYPYVFPRDLCALGALVVAALFTYVGNGLLAGSFDLYDLWGQPPRSFIEVSIALVGVGVMVAIGGLAVLVRGWRLVLLGVGIAAGLFSSPALLFRVCDSAYNSRPDSVGGPTCERSAGLLTLVSGSELALTFAGALMLNQRRR